MSRGNRSLWLVPGEPDARQLQSVIDELAKLFGGPSFRPHLTLCSRVTGAAPGVGALPISVRWSELDGDEDYYHACYLPVLDQGELRALQTKCAEAWQGRVAAAYPPHLSLAYGSLTEAQRRRAREAAAALPPSLTFPRWELWQTEGPVATWRKLSEGGG